MRILEAYTLGKRDAGAESGCETENGRGERI
jgi:hypothetical protein